MALGDLMASRFSQSVTLVSNHLDQCSVSVSEEVEERNGGDLEVVGGGFGDRSVVTVTSMAYLPQTSVLCEVRHEAFEVGVPAGPSNTGLVSKWRPKDRVSWCGGFCVI